MKFRVAFFFSQAESELKLRFLKWKWKWSLPLDKENEEPEIDCPPKKDKQSKDRVPKFLLKAILYPETRNRIWQFVKKLIYRVYNLFSLKFENIEVRGTFGDPFYDSIALGVSRGCYYPQWENENGIWSAKGEVTLRTGFLRGFLFLFSFIYQTSALTFVLWRSLRRAKRAAQ